MPEQTTQEQQHPEFQAYVKGFNQGYILADNMPNVADALATTKSNEPWISGVRDGKEQFDAEQLRSLRPKWLDQDHGVTKDFNAAKDQDRNAKTDPGPAKDAGKEER